VGKKCGGQLGCARVENGGRRTARLVRACTSHFLAARGQSRFRRCWLQACDLDFARRRRPSRTTGFAGQRPARRRLVAGWELDRLPAVSPEQVGVGQKTTGRRRSGAACRCQSWRRRYCLVCVDRPARHEPDLGVGNLDTQSGKELKTANLRLPVSALVDGFSLHPDGTSFITSVGIPKFDIWLLEGFNGAAKSKRPIIIH